MRISRVCGATVAELIGQHRQAELVSEQMINEWLGMHQSKFQRRYDLMAKALWLRYCSPNWMSFPEIATELDCRTNYAQEIVHDGFQKLQKYPHFYCLEEEKGKAIEVGTQLYVDIWGCELRCCSTAKSPQTS